MTHSGSYSLLAIEEEEVITQYWDTLYAACWQQGDACWQTLNFVYHGMTMFSSWFNLIPLLSW